MSEYSAPDLTYLKELSGGNEEFLKQIITIFLEDTPDMLNKIKDGISSGNLEQVRFYSHKLVSQLPMVGINDAVDDARTIDREYKSLPDMPQRVARMIDIIEYGMVYLKKIAEQ
jgi:HPt (histidine-containing phosphotransfer) domain-containing protein